MAKENANSNVQLTLFPCQGTSAKDNKNGRNAKSLTLNDYLKTRDGLWRLIACFPHDMTVKEAVRLMSSQIAKQKGGTSC